MHSLVIRWRGIWGAILFSKVVNFLVFRRFLELHLIPCCLASHCWQEMWISAVAAWRQILQRIGINCFTWLWWFEANGAQGAWSSDTMRRNWKDSFVRKPVFFVCFYNNFCLSLFCLNIWPSCSTVIQTGFHISFPALKTLINVSQCVFYECFHSSLQNLKLSWILYSALKEWKYNKFSIFEL